MWGSLVTYLENLPLAVQDEYIMWTKPKHTALLLAHPPICLSVIPPWALKGAGNHRSVCFWLAVPNDVYIFSVKFSKLVWNIFRDFFFPSFPSFLPLIPSLSSSSSLSLNIKKKQSNRWRIDVFFLCVLTAFLFVQYPFPKQLLSGTWVLTHAVLWLDAESLSRWHCPVLQKGSFLLTNQRNMYFPQSINLKFSFGTCNLEKNKKIKN